MANAKRKPVAEAFQVESSAPTARWADEARALAQLRRCYQRDVEEVAKRHKAQLLAGDFNGICDSAEFGTDLNMHKLEAICLEHHRMRDPSLHVVTIMLSSAFIRNREAGNLDWEDDRFVAQYAGMCFTMEVQAYAVRAWGAPRDDVWEVPA
ncbi:hypothetical protein [Anaeromyxobacter paludicola]|uniref:Uncharacterized protein n=1 Tax=Anaeromyxobacter paludicola TaxID=2918171 RepID=A0ABM7X5B1_9BACT|nr:hypothetical protein [Anaeromyxobacter paludicola]BDG06992.1 hypothetical protein AMPC_01050 [Anaeromyxobacter paludicola]